MSITRFAVHKSTTVMVLIFMITVMGLVSYFSMPREAAPNIKIPYMIVTTIYPGVAPADIENLITRPIEQQLKSLKDVRQITSSSSEGFSVISIEFEPTVDLDYALQRTKDRVDGARGDLPTDVNDPNVTEISFENMPIINVVLSADYDLAKLKTTADNLKDAFETIPGVNQATITGLRDREMQIYVDPGRLKDYNLSFFDVYNTIMQEHTTIPGGSMDISDFTYSVRVPGEIRTADGFKDLVVTATADGPVYIRDLANVTYGFTDPTTFSRLNSKPSVTINISKRAGENIISIIDQVKKIVAAQQPDFPRGTYVSYADDQSEFIGNMVHELENNIITGFILVVICIFLFLGVVNSIFIATSIPLSMFITFVVLSMMGISMNMIVMFTLIMALGMVVDDAVVIVENIFRHRQMGFSPEEASIKGPDQVAAAVISSTLTTVVAFIPLLFWPGIMGEFMKYMPVTVIIALIASLIMALVVNPVLCVKFMKVKQKDKDQFATGTGFFYNVILNNYSRALSWALNNPRTVMVLTGCVFVITFAAFAKMNNGVELMPTTDPEQAWVDIIGPVGQRLETTDQYASQIEKALQGTPDLDMTITNVGVSTGSSGFGGGSDNSNEARIYLDFLPFEKRKQSSLDTFNSLFNKVNFLTGAQVRLDKETMGPPVGAAISIQVAGSDFMRLGEFADDIQARIKNTPGLVDLKDDFIDNKPEIIFRVDREKAEMLGVSTTDVAMALRTAINGFDAGNFRDGEDQYQITVRFPASDRKAMPDLNKIYVFHDSNNIPLSSLGGFETSAGMGTITRVDLKRVVTITGSAYGRLSDDVRNDVMKTLADFSLPAGYAISYVGENEYAEESQVFLEKALGVVFLLVTMVLIAQFNSLVLPLIIMFSATLSLIGVLWGLLISGLPFGIIMTGVGVISLVGVVVKNAIVLLDYTQKLRVKGMSRHEAIYEAGRTRFRPVIMTAITTIVGIIPLAIGWSFNLQTMSITSSATSAQWWSPMAIAIIYGLGVATILTLVIVPAMYILLGDKDK